MLDLSTGEALADDFYDLRATRGQGDRGQKHYLCGEARNAIIVDDETGEEDPDGRCLWTVGIDAPNGNPDDTIYLSGDYYMIIMMRTLLLM